MPTNINCIHIVNGDCTCPNRRWFFKLLQRKFCIEYNHHSCGYKVMRPRPTKIPDRVRRS